MKAAPILIVLLATAVFAGGASARTVGDCVDTGAGLVACLDAGSTSTGPGTCAASSGYHEEGNGADAYVGADDGTYRAASVRTFCDASQVGGQPYRYHDVLVSTDHNDPDAAYGQTALDWGASDHGAQHWCDTSLDVESRSQSLGCPAGDPPGMGALLP